MLIRHLLGSKCSKVIRVMMSCANLFYKIVRDCINLIRVLILAHCSPKITTVESGHKATT